MMPRKMSLPLKVAAAGLTVVIGTACMDLAVTNPNEPDRDRALADELAVESLVGGSFQTWWEIKQGRAPSRFLSQAAETHASSSLNHGTWDSGHMPRKPVVNLPGYQWGYPIEDPWLLLYRANAAIRDALLMMKGGLQIGANGADTPRLQALAKLLLGLNHGFLAKLYDQGWIVDEEVDTEERVANADLRSYREVMDAARGYFAEARQIASQNTFTIPAGWLGQRSYSNQDLIRISHSYEARFLTAVARSPEERAQVDWNVVLSHIEQGVTEDFGVELDGPGGIWPKGAGLKTSRVVAQRLLGPADQSGAWQEWEATEPRDREWFYVETDDRRIHAPGNKEQSGKQFELEKNAVGNQVVYNEAQRGLWYQTPYRTFDWTQIRESSTGFAPDLTVEEMDFLRAEAYIRLNRPADALPIINRTRVENGELPAVGVEGDRSARCVPRTVTGTCGDLMAALIYEKSLETLWVSAGLDYFDARGLGTLVPGTFIHLPVPAVELGALRLPIYTFGGEAGGASP